MVHTRTTTQGGSLLCSLSWHNCQIRCYLSVTFCHLRYVTTVRTLQQVLYYIDYTRFHSSPTKLMWLDGSSTLRH